MSRDGEPKSYKGLVITLFVILVILIIGAFIYWRQLNATQQQQQQQIDSLNQQLTETKNSASQKTLDAKNQRINELNSRNTALQKQLDSATSTSTQTTTAPTTTTPTSQ